METHVRWEVWVSDSFFPIANGGKWRFNARFDRLKRADEEAEWYKRHGYTTDVRVRTTRYQRREHVRASIAAPDANATALACGDVEFIREGTICGGLCEPMCKQCHQMADEAAEYRSDGAIEWPEGSGG